MAEKFFYALVRITKLTAVAFIKNKNDTLVFQFCHFRLIPQFADGSIQFLNGGNNEF